MKKYIFFVAALAVIGATFAYISLYAQGTPQGLMVVPSNLSLDLKPGTETVKTITLYNNTDNDVEIIPQTRNFTAQGEEGDVTLTSSDTGYSLASWITVAPEKTTIKSRGSADFTYVVKVPQNAEPGGHFGSIVLSTVKPEGNLGQTGAYVIQQVGALILAKVPGDVNESARLESFTSNKNFYIEGPVDFDIRVKNDSTVHITPSGTITIKDMFGRKEVIPVESRNVLPGAIRRLFSTWNSKFMVGKYTADVSLYYGSSNQNLKGSLVFYAFPVYYALIVLAVIAVIVIFRKRFFKALRIIIIGK